MRILLPTCLFLTHFLPAQALTWPGFRGPQHDGVGRAAGNPPIRWSAEENLVYQTRLPGPGASSPILVGDKVYLTCYSGYGAHLDDGGDHTELEHHLVCLDQASGKILFDRAVPGPLPKPARQVQIQEHGFASPTPVCDGKAIYCYFGRAGLLAFDLEGKQLWQTDLGEPTPGAPKATNTVERNGQTLSLRWGTAASPVLFEGLVIVNSSEQNNSLCAFDKQTGKRVWRKETANLEGCAVTPMVLGEGKDAVLVMVLGGEVWGLDPRTGKEIWSLETKMRGGISPTPVRKGEVVYIFGGGDKGMAVRWPRQLPEGQERILWQSESLGIPSAVLAGDKLLLVRTNGMGVGMQVEDGKVIFDKRLPGRTSSVYASPLLVKDRIYVVSRKRGCFVYSADGKFELLSRNELADDSQFNGSPAVAGDRLFLRSDRHLYCVGAKSKQK